MIVIVLAAGGGFALGFLAMGWFRGWLRSKIGT